MIWKPQTNIIPGGNAHLFSYGVWKMDLLDLETWNGFTGYLEGRELFVLEAHGC